VSESKQPLYTVRRVRIGREQELIDLLTCAEFAVLKESRNAIKSVAGHDKRSGEADGGERPDASGERGSTATIRASAEEMLELLGPYLRSYRPTEEERRAFAISFAYGNLRLDGCDVTRESIEKVFDELYAADSVGPTVVCNHESTRQEKSSNVPGDREIVVCNGCGCCWWAD
jgi:hypothetical protein